MAVAPHLRDHANIDKEAVLVGVDDHLELWNKDAWTRFLSQNEDEFKGMAGAIFGGEEPEPEPVLTGRGE
jgi:MraZ protein